MTGSLNKNILLSSDFFATICRPDLFSKQGIINLKEKIIKWKRERENLTLVAKRNSDVPFGNVIADRLTYIGYIINDYNVYGGKIINDHDNVVQGILPELAKLSIELSRNGLMEISKESPL
ncbi:MAG: hypothetical protein LBI53_02525 [Candidatus Peribacteria bacterium]|jgi:hypothetical protein|nr:hypothetical protein [Candidatus Peribacteria bacterium]